MFPTLLAGAVTGTMCIRLVAFGIVWFVALICYSKFGCNKNVFFSLNIKKKASRSYSIFFTTTTIILPCIVIMVCYLKIYQFAHQANKKISERNARRSRFSDFKRSYQIAKGLFSSYMLFVICWYVYKLTQKKTLF